MALRIYEPRAENVRSVLFIMLGLGLGFRFR